MGDLECHLETEIDDRRSAVAGVWATPIGCIVHVADGTTDVVVRPSHSRRSCVAIVSSEQRLPSVAATFDERAAHTVVRQLDRQYG